MIEHFVSDRDILLYAEWGQRPASQTLTDLLGTVSGGGRATTT
jgi:hypothetical protein